MNQMAAQLSIREISRRTGVPESTLRYYRSLFPQYIPTVGSGRNRRHPEHAVSVFQRIAQLFSAGESRWAVRRALDNSLATPDPDGQVFESRAPEVTRGAEIELVQPETGLQRVELENFLTAMMVRDRELASMHRDLLELLEKLIHALGSLAGTQVRWGHEQRADPLIPAPPRDDSAVADEPAASDSLEIEGLRDRLIRERETVERLRRARLELEQRLARLEKEGRGR
jgi:DNA-binding transcriptional MerR regulator